MLFKKDSNATYLVVGLGNPGKEYENSRHNVGFISLDYYAKENKIKINKYSCNSLCGTIKHDGKKIILSKPQTYMNNSGVAVAELMSYYKIPIENVIIVCDDISLENGKIRIRRSGTNGGHNGLKSIEAFVGSQDYKRIKIGVGDRTNKEEDLKDWVLGHFTDDERKEIEECIKKVSSSISLIIDGKIDTAMNMFN